MIIKLAMVLKMTKRGPKSFFLPKSLKVYFFYFIYFIIEKDFVVKAQNNFLVLRNFFQLG